MPTRHGRRTLAVCVVATLAAGCGAAHKPTANTSSDAARVNTVLRSYLRAQAHGDGTAACGLLTVSAQNQLIDLVMSAGKGLITTRPACSDAVALAHAVAGTQLLSALENARIEQIHVIGAGATAQVSDGTTFKPRQVRLEKIGGSWKIAGVPSLGAGAT